MGANNLKSLPLKNSNSILSNFLNSSNPNDFLQKMISNNPKAQNVMQLLNSSGKSPKQFFYQYAQQQQINPDQFLNSLIKGVERN